MATIPDNILDEVGRELAGLQASGQAEQPAEPSGSLGALLRRYTELANELRTCSERAESLEAEIKPLQEALLEAYAENGLQRATLNGLTVFVRHDFFASKKAGVSTESLCETLVKCGCEYLVKTGYNANSLRAKVREWRDEGVEIPAPLAELLSVGEIPRVVAVKAS